MLKYQNYLEEKTKNMDERFMFDAKQEETVLRIARTALEDPKIRSMLDDELFDVNEQDFDTILKWLKRVT